MRFISLFKISTLLFIFPFTLNASKLSKADLIKWSEYTCLDNVEDAFKKLPIKGKKFKLNSEKMFKNKKEYRNTLLNKLGLDNHFQGITYLKDKDVVVLSGGNVNTKSGMLLVTNPLNQKNARFNKRIDVKGENELWHAGSIARLQNLLIVPVERFKPTKKSEIQFFNIDNPSVPQKMDFSVKINDDKTGAVDAIIDKKSKKIKVFAFDTKSFSIYESKTSKIEEGFKFVKKMNSKVFNGANMKVVQQCDGKIYFAELTNDGIVPPFLNGKNIVNLYHFDEKADSTKRVLKKKFDCDKYCNFRGAASVVTEDNRLELIASKMYREKRKDLIKMSRFE